MRAIFLAALLLAGCRDEPTIVIKFDPGDAAVAPKPAEPVAPVAVTAPADAAAPAAAKPTDGKKPAECKVADDCTVEPEDCCDCANGGKQHAIAKSQVAASKKARDARCKEAMCTMMLSVDPTCGKRADCVAGQCVMVDKKPATK